MSEAIAVARMYLGRTNTECLTADELVVLEAFDLLERHNLDRKRIADTLLAATLLHHGISELITCNVGDFEGFEGLKVIDPR
jgi:predicted nucleic acid-binding protein